jgi:pyridoxal phosphate phosphatase PHOSPHO2
MSYRQDIAFVRKDMELAGRIKEEGASLGLKCQVRYWSGAWEIDEWVGTLVNYG